jgi:hypothetical protein
MILKMKIQIADKNGRKRTQTVEFKTRELTLSEIRYLVESEIFFNSIGNAKIHMELRDEVIKEGK